MGRRTYHYYSRQPFLQPHAPFILSILPIIPVLCPVPRVPHYSHYYAGILGASLEIDAVLNACVSGLKKDS